jgi:hypothetical protein
MLINDVLLMTICGNKVEQLITHSRSTCPQKHSSTNHYIQQGQFELQVTMSGSAPNDAAPGGHSRDLEQTPLDANQHGQAQ